MKTILHKASSRGHFDHGWLKTYHTFSFADYYDPARMNFGALRVLNDDYIAPGHGFPMHPHSNMEIITIPLEGELEHEDSMGNKETLRQGEIQVMSAGTGILHSEYNRHPKIPLKLLQIWVITGKKNAEPRYEQHSLDPGKARSGFLQIVSPDSTRGAWIHQQAWFFIGRFDKGNESVYTLHNSNNGVYGFVIEGKFTVEKTELDTRDGLGVWDIKQLSIKAEKDDSLILLMEVPLL